MTVSLADQWQKFEKMFLPPGASASQRHDMRAAFYAGATVVMLVAYRISEPDVSVLEAIDDEIIAFAKQFQVPLL
jgi:hypothetical protein